MPRIVDILPMLSDRDEPSGAIRDHYFWQDLWAASKIFERAPEEHFDIGSRVDGFILALLSFRSVTMIDIRPLPVEVPRLHFRQANATALADFADQSIDSISSLHAVEHFGLGRYGDPIDPGAAARSMRELARVCRPSGRVYFSVPIGRERTCFNAHRVFGPSSVLAAFGDLTLASFAGVDNGRFRTDCDPDDYRDADYACGLFEFTRPG